MCIAAVVLLSALGLLIAVLADGAVKDTVVYALCGGGLLIAFVVGMSGSPSRNYSDSRIELGGRFTDSPPLPMTPLRYALVGLVCLGVGTLVLFLA